MRRELGRIATLLLLRATTVRGPTEKFDCASYPLPIQVLKATGANSYSTMQLDIAAQDYTEVFSWSNDDTATAPSDMMNAMGYNVMDDIAYGLFRPASSTDAYLCRFSHVPDSQDCLCNTGFWAYTATITTDGTYYFSNGGTSIYKIPNTHDIVSPPSPASISTLPSCTTYGMSGQLTSSRGTDPSTIDVTAWGLSAEDMKTAYDLPTSCSVSTCYMSVWTYDSGNDGAATSQLDQTRSHVQSTRSSTPGPACCKPRMLLIA